jgi:hypothetical protein
LRAVAGLSIKPWDFGVRLDWLQHPLLGAGLGS